MNSPHFVHQSTIVVAVWIRQIKLQHFLPDAVLELIQTFGDNDILDKKDWKRWQSGYFGLNHEIPSLSVYRKWTFTASQRDEEICIRFVIEKIGSKPGDVQIGVSWIGEAYYMEGLFGSLRTCKVIQQTVKTSTKWNYARADHTAMVFISDMDDPVIKDGSIVDMIMTYSHREKHCSVSFIVDGRDLGEAFKETLPLQITVHRDRLGTKMEVYKHNHKYGL